MVRKCLFVLLVLANWPGHASADDTGVLPPAATRQVDFSRDIQSMFQEHCLKCHGANKQRGDFRLDQKTIALRGGDSFAPAIIPGRSSESPLVRLVAGLVEGMQMPPAGEGKLSNDEIGLLRAWIDQGAIWPDELQLKDDISSHWSFQRLSRPVVPVISPEVYGWDRNPIDAFVAARLTGTNSRNETTPVHKLVPSVEADRATLIRRMTYDLLGLPTTPEEFAGFLADSRPDAVERLTDRLLASPHFGERWARHWLDVVRFAESDGFETNQPRPNAWPYRDFVIRAFNEDLPIRDFLFQQLAGDTLGIDEATGFLVAGAWDRVKSPDPGLTAQQRADELHDMVSTTASAFFGLTVGCARCHNHKFDPISQVDYYAMKAAFSGVQHGERPINSAAADQNQKLSEAIRTELARVDMELIRYEPIANIREADGMSKRSRRPVRRQANIDRFLPVTARFVRFSIEATTGGEPCLDELEVFEATTASLSKNVARSDFVTKVTSSSNLPGSEIHQLSHVNDGRYGNSASWISNEPGRGWVMLEFIEPVDIDLVIWSRDRPENGQFQDRIPTSYRIEAGLTVDSLTLVASSEDRLDFGSSTSSLPAFNDEGLSEKERAIARPLVARRNLLQQQVQSLAATQVVYAGRFVIPEPTNRLHRGDPLLPKEPTLPAGLTAFGATWQLANDSTDSERRRALASGIASPEHPLTARVMVNRLWQFHFGQGLVATPSDFGRNGVPPSHPELLDWLASETNEGNSPKRLHRMIVNSATYRQSSQMRPEALQVDAATRLLWRFPPRRLEAEPIRDAILSISGNLDDRMQGPGFDLFEPNTNYVKVYNSKRQLGPAESRRMVYQAKPRMQLDEIFGQFDCPDAGQIAPKRTSSITALQALNLLNSRFIVQQATLFSARLRLEAGADPAAQVDCAYWLAFLRQPSDEEKGAAIELISNHSLDAFCRAILNANEFMFVF